MIPLVIDKFSLVYDLLQPWAVAEFYDLEDHEPVPGAVYVIGRQRFVEQRDLIVDMIESGLYTVVFDNAAEGSLTLMEQIREYDLEQYTSTNQLLIIGGGDMLYTYPYIRYDYFISVFTGYQENIDQMARINEIYAKPAKPYKFMFLNGRARLHRQYLWHQFDRTGLLDQSLWTMLESRGFGQINPERWKDGGQLLTIPCRVQNLPAKYEVAQYRNVPLDPGQERNIKRQLFGNTWGDVYLQAEPYIDTYFSVVTETVAERPWSFRTEKIVKPIAQGHPWICVAGPGFYKDLRDLGFRTFSGLIDESFDQIDDLQSRLDRIHAVVQDLCQQDLASFLDSCYSICKYNQQHLLEVSAAVKKEFPSRFFEFITQYRE